MRYSWEPVLALPAQRDPAPEYQIKAVFLFNFAQFVEWPAGAFPQAATPLVIGILGEDPFNGYLDETVRGETVNSHPLVVQRFRAVEEVKACHILFISRGETQRLTQILASLKGRYILVVSDAGQQGEMIKFFTEKNKIRLRINAEATRAAGLTISSKLLRLADTSEN